MAPTVVIVDDHAGFRRMARRMFEEAGLVVVAEAADGESGLSAVAALAPQLVLVDIQLPDLDGFAVARRLAQARTDAVVILTSSRSASDYGSRLARSPARVFIPKAELSGPALLGVLGAVG